MKKKVFYQKSYLFVSAFSLKLVWVKVMDIQEYYFFLSRTMTSPIT